MCTYCNMCNEPLSHSETRVKKKNNWAFIGDFEVIQPIASFHDKESSFLESCKKKTVFHRLIAKIGNNQKSPLLSHQYKSIKLSSIKLNQIFLLTRVSTQMQMYFHAILFLFSFSFWDVIILVLLYAYKINWVWVQLKWNGRMCMIRYWKNNRSRCRSLSLSLNRQWSVNYTFNRMFGKCLYLWTIDYIYDVYTYRIYCFLLLVESAFETGQWGHEKTKHLIDFVNNFVLKINILVVNFHSKYNIDFVHHNHQLHIQCIWMERYTKIYRCWNISL